MLAPTRAKDEVKTHHGPPTRSRGPEGSETFSIIILPFINKIKVMARIPYMCVALGDM